LSLFQDVTGPKKMDVRFDKLFNNYPVPEWITISTAFSHMLSLVWHRPEYDLQPTGHFDITTPCSNQNIPDSDLWSDLNEFSGREVKCFRDINEALIWRLKEGNVRSQGILCRTQRILYHGNKQTRDINIESNRHTDIDRAFWKEQPTVNYRTSSITLWEEDPENVHDEIERQDGFLVDFRAEENRFIWKEEWTDIQVHTTDLLKSEEPLLIEYCQKKDIHLKDSSETDVMKPTGTNRFFYSPTLDKWVVEYKKAVFCTNHKKNSVVPQTIQTLLRNGNTDLSEAVEHNTWSSLYRSKEVKKLTKKLKALLKDETIVAYQQPMHLSGPEERTRFAKNAKEALNKLKRQKKGMPPGKELIKLNKEISLIKKLMYS